MMATKRIHVKGSAWKLVGVDEIVEILDNPDTNVIEEDAQLTALRQAKAEYFDEYCPLTITMLDEENAEPKPITALEYYP